VPVPPPQPDQDERPGPRVALVVLAAGDGRRAGHDTNKVLLPLAGRRVFTWGIRWGRGLERVTHTVLVIRDQDRMTVRQVLEREVDGPPVLVVDGGESRHASEWAALQGLAPAIHAEQVDVVVIHDAARPLASTQLFADVVETAMRDGGAVPVLEQHGLTSLDDRAPPHGDGEMAVVSVQTPQAFRAAPLLAAYSRAATEGFVGTDTASCMERYTELPVRCVAGDARNIKITYPEDLFLAERLLSRAEYDLSRTSARERSTTAQIAEHPHLPHLTDLLRRRPVR
jgi:2-C-methyl-D-erythritol 4-phosphate cytidylyltransferase